MSSSPSASLAPTPTRADDAFHLEVAGLCKRFPGAGEAAVDDVSFRARRGELVTLLGPSGCGKSTTLRIIAGFEAPERGRVVIGGEEVTAVPPNRRGVGMVFQSYALFPNLTVRENVAFGLRLRRRADDEVHRRVDELLALVRLDGLADRAPGQLSGGQQQRVALARALAIEPQLLLLDEPLAALDAVVRQELRVEIRRIQARLGTTTVYVTHDQEEALSLSDRVVVMNRGRIEQIGTPEEIYGTPKTAFVAGFVGRLNVLAGTLTDGATGALRLPGGSITLGRPLYHEAGTTLRVAVRPENLAFGPLPAPGAAAPDQIVGEVDEVEFLGAVVLVHVRAGDARVTVQELNSPTSALPRVGKQVAVRVPPEVVLVLPESSPSGGA
jgi:putative spermidine/putrescine transport system ATP-binding protein